MQILGAEPGAQGLAGAQDAAAFEMAVERGATPVECPRGPGELEIPAIEGIGGSYLYLVDRYGARVMLTATGLGAVCFRDAQGRVLTVRKTGYRLQR